ncbi:MAG: YbhB/YbcL family Raf kinase inhibitor-like protein [Planctomycetota bacterium]
MSYRSLAAVLAFSCFASPSFAVDRGDVNDDGTINLTDAVSTLNYLFANGEGPVCLAAADADANGQLNISDPVFVLRFLFLAGDAPSPLSGAEQGDCSGEFTLGSSAFANGERIPSVHTCDGEDYSPQLTWGGVPEGTVSFALTFIDIDVGRGGFIHWTGWNIPGDARRHAEREAPPVEGTSSFGRRSWGGPCTPRGAGNHRYVFSLYALDTELEVRAGARLAELLDAMSDHVLGRAVLQGLYSR